MTNATHVALFAGIGGFELAGEEGGIKTLLSSEIDQPASRVLAERFPSLALQDDVTTLSAEHLGGQRPGVISAGSPCQDFSIAGLRSGLAGSRSGLFEHVIRLRDELRPRFVLWENVPGALTSNKGEDFANVLGALVGADDPLPLPKHPSGRRSRYAGVAYGPKGTLAWRVLDAQHFGVPQRRQRVIAVLDTEGSASVEVLFPEMKLDVPRSLRRNSSWALPLDDRDDLDVGMAPPDPVKTRLAEILEPEVDERYYLPPDAAHRLLVRGARLGQQLQEPYAEALDRQSAGCPPLSLEAPATAKLRAGKPGGGKGWLLSLDRSLTLATGNDQYLFDQTGRVRKLTPVECERLQGFPDGWTDVEGAKDSQRYKQLGNAVAVPMARWVMGRIARYLTTV